MKKLITFIASISYVLVFSQKNINQELAEAEKFANKIIENNPDKILRYYKLNNGTLKKTNPNNENEDDDSEIMMSYRIIKKMIRSFTLVNLIVFGVWETGIVRRTFILMNREFCSEL